jgi:hypothetical protein
MNERKERSGYYRRERSSDEDEDRCVVLLLLRLLMLHVVRHIIMCAVFVLCPVVQTQVTAPHSVQHARW